MAFDSLFYTERDLLKKAALLFTIPCAILPVLMATAGFLSIPFAPLFFKYDFILFGCIYALYGYGLFASWQTHKSPVPFLVIILHLAVTFIYAFYTPAQWLGYLSVISIIATSASNQYFRMGSFECNDCAVAVPEKNTD
jgi:hypothetical protein